MYPDGIRHIRADKRVNEWKAPGKKTVIRCAVNRRQVVIALSGGELVYFEMDPGILNTEITQRYIMIRQIYIIIQSVPHSQFILLNYSRDNLMSIQKEKICLPM